MVVYQRARARWTSASSGAWPLGGVPDGDQAQAGQFEGHGAFHRTTEAIAGLAHTEDLAGVGECLWRWFMQHRGGHCCIERDHVILTGSLPARGASSVLPTRPQPG